MPETTVTPDLPPGMTAAEAVRSPEFWSDVYQGAMADEAPPEVVADQPEADAPATPPRDEKGRFTKAVEQIVEGADPDAEAAPASANRDPSEEEPPVDAEAVKDAAPKAEERKPITGFATYDKEGEVALPDDLEVEFKANGEVRRMPLDKAIRLAQSGYYNEQLQQEVKSARELKAQYDAQVADLQVRFERQAALNRQLLSDDTGTAWQQAVEQYRQMYSPEARAQRAEQELQAVRAQAQQQQQVQQAQTFFEGNLVPKVTALLSQYPTVSDAEASGWLAPNLKALEINGVIPPHRYADVLRLLETDLGPWMAQQHLQRSETAKAETAKRQVEVRRAQVEATKAKRQLAQAVAPVRATGTTGTPVSSAKSDRMKSAKQINAEFWQSMGMGRDED